MPNKSILKILEQMTGEDRAVIMAGRTVRVVRLDEFDFRKVAPVTVARMALDPFSQNLLKAYCEPAEVQIAGVKIQAYRISEFGRDAVQASWLDMGW